MAYIVNLKSHSDARGGLTVIEKDVPFDIRRIYYIYDVPGESVRGGHRHHKAIQALICIQGSCEVFVNDGKTEAVYLLDRLDRCLIVEPQDWHTMSKFADNAILIVLSSEYYNPDDYIKEEH